MRILPAAAFAAALSLFGARAEAQSAPAAPLMPMPTPPAAPPPAASTPPAIPLSPILRVELRTDTPEERRWLAHRLEAGLRVSPLSFNAVASTPEKIRGEVAFRDSPVLNDPFRERGAVILFVRPSGMGMQILADFTELKVNYYNNQTKMKSPDTDQQTRYRVGLAGHLRPLLLRDCAGGRCSVS